MSGTFLGFRFKADTLVKSLFRPLPESDDLALVRDDEPEESRNLLFAQGRNYAYRKDQASEGRPSFGREKNVADHPQRDQVDARQKCRQPQPHSLRQTILELVPRQAQGDRENSGKRVFLLSQPAESANQQKRKTRQPGDAEEDHRGTAHAWDHTDPSGVFVCERDARDAYQHRIAGAPSTQPQYSPTALVPDRLAARTRKTLI